MVCLQQFISGFNIYRNVKLIYCRKAATKAGFNVLRIINEPSAALLAYGIGQKDPAETW